MGPYQFFLPLPDDVFAGLPSTIESYWDWQATASGIGAHWGQFHWVLQTYLYLRTAGLPVSLVNQMPPEGVCLTHIDCVDYSFRPSDRQYLVLFLVDRLAPHPHAQLHVVHNPRQGLPFGMPSRYMPSWPQIGLLPRDAARGERFERIGYFGYTQNLEPEISGAAFHARLAEMGLSLFVPDAKDWHDFRNIDAVMAVRTFGRDKLHLNRPALKLFNAWMAGVPAIIGHEVGCRQEGAPGADYLEATSSQALLACLQLLKDDPARRQALVAAGQERVRDFLPAPTIERWKALLSDYIDPAHETWRRSRLTRIRQRALGSLLERWLWRRPGVFSLRPPALASTSAPSSR